MHNNKHIFQINNKTIFLLFVLNILFVIYFFSLAFYNRLSQDDFLFLKSVKESGCIHLVKWAYLFQSGRFSHYLYISIIFWFIEKTGQLFFIPVLVWLINFSILQYGLKKLLNLDNLLLLNLSALFINIFIITNFEFTAFYWICATFYYIQPVLIFLLFIYVNQKTITKFHSILLIIIALVISGSSEIFIPFCLLFLLLNYGYYFLNNNYNFNLTISDNRVKRLIISFLIIFIGFVILLIAPGNYIRAQESIFQHPNNFIELIKITTFSFGLFFYLLVFKFPYFVILILFSILIGFSNRSKYLIKFNYKKFLLCSWGSYCVFIFLNVLPTAYLMSGFGFQRIYSTTIFFSICFFVLQGFVFGLNKCRSINLNTLKWMILINLLVLSSVLVYNLVVDIPIAKKYYQSDINRSSLLLTYKKQHHKGLVQLDPLNLPYTHNLKYLILRKNQPMLYYSNEIASDSTAYPNMCLKSYYELDFLICVRNQK